MKISIVMPAFNASKTIARSIDSVVAQTHTSWELNIIDDGSTDDTCDVLGSYSQDPRISLTRLPANLGVAHARNIGINAASCEFIAFLDADDVWMPQKLEKQMRFMQKTGAELSYTATAYFSDAGRSSYVLQAKPQLTYRDMLKQNLMSLSGVIVKKPLIMRHPFPQGHMHEDYAVWLSLLREIDIAHGLNEPLLLYRLSHTSKSGARKRSAQMVYNAYRKIGIGKLCAFTYTIRYALRSISKRVLIRFYMRK